MEEANFLFDKNNEIQSEIDRPDGSKISEVIEIFALKVTILIDPIISSKRLQSSVQKITNHHEPFTEFIIQISRSRALNPPASKDNKNVEA